MRLPTVSVIVPCRNEAAYIGVCLESVLRNSGDFHILEIYVIDGESNDSTRESVRSYCARDSRVQLLSNPSRTQSPAINIGLDRARGEFVLRVDAHAELSPNYIAECLAALNAEPSVDAAGGMMTTIPREDTRIGRIISAALTSPFGVGRSPFRTGVVRPKEVATVFCGFYRRRVIQRIGRLNEELARGEDVEYHTRLRAAGGRIMLIPAATVRYRARSTWGWKFIRYYFREGFWAVYPSALVGNSYLSASRLAPCGLVVGLASAGAIWLLGPAWGWMALGLPALYGAMGVAAAGAAAWRRRSWTALVLLPLVFATMHIPYGAGSLVAFARRFSMGWKAPAAAS